MFAQVRPRGSDVKQTAFIAGVGMTRFGKHLDRSLSSLAHEAIAEAMADAGITAGQIQAAWAGTAGAPVVTGQVCIAGQQILREIGIGRIPVINVENACATGSTAFQQACSMVTAGAYDVALAFGVEKLYHADKQRAMQVFLGCIDTEHPERLQAYVNDGRPPVSGEERPRSLFMDIYARMTRDYMARSSATARHFAMVSAKNSRHGNLNSRAQFGNVVTIEEVLAAPMIADPLTLTMCSPIGDGAAAAIVVSEKFAREKGLKTVRVRSSLVASGFDEAKDGAGLVEWAAEQSRASSGIAMKDVNCVELHDATSPAEMMIYEALGLCAPGEGPAFLESGATEVGGRVPVNTSGGLVRKGHPIGATGLSQIYELTQQLRGRADKRQVEGARIALAENGGGFLGHDGAAIVMTVLER
jgi:acetyl-CoA acetyltransferase